MLQKQLQISCKNSGTAARVSTIGNYFPHFASRGRNQEVVRQQEAAGAGQRHGVPSWGFFPEFWDRQSEPRALVHFQEQIVIVLLWKVVAQDARCPWASRLFFSPHFLHRKEVKVFLKGGYLWGNLSGALPCPRLLPSITQTAGLGTQEK